ncbi:MAG: transposase, partial [Nitrospira sp.]|nr:transposase [Nitrospira sp.]
VCGWLVPIAQRGEIWMKEQQVAFSGRMAADEKWVWVRDHFEYLFVAVDSESGYALHARLYPSNGGWACKSFLLEVRQLGYKPLVIVTDGWDGYIEAIREVFPLAEHLLCRFHVLKTLFRRLRKAKVWEKKVWS